MNYKLFYENILELHYLLLYLLYLDLIKHHPYVIQNKNNVMQVQHLVIVYVRHMEVIVAYVDILIIMVVNVLYNHYTMGFALIMEDTIL